MVLNVDEAVTVSLKHKHSKTVRLRRTEQLAFLQSAEREKLPLVPRVGMLLEYAFCKFIFLNFTLGILLRLTKLMLLFAVTVDGLRMTTMVETFSHT
jgi:hypothetical protein